MFETIDWHIEDGIGFIQLNQPPANIMSKLFFHEIHELSDTLLNNTTIHALIISGKGRHFSSGADINDLLSFDKDSPQQIHGRYYRLH